MSESTTALSAERRQLLAALLARRGLQPASERVTRDAVAALPIPRRSADFVEKAPASAAQRRLWLLAQFDGGSTAYNMPGLLRLHGALNVAALQAALDAIIDRHEVLRTRFAVAAGEVMQIIDAPASMPLALDDLSALAPAQREASLHRWAQDEAQSTFDLARGPLFRGRLIRLGDDAHALLLSMHHIVSDGWSLQVLVRELATAYAQVSQGQLSPGRPSPGQAVTWPALPLQYADYAVWQRHWLQQAAPRAQLAAWRTHLDGAPALLELPCDRARPAVQNYRGASLPMSLGAPLSAAVRQFAQHRGLTVFMVLYAALAILLSKLSGQRDLVIGTPVANRRRAELEGLIGFFVNTLALRVDVDPEADGATLLTQVQALSLAAYERQDVPFEEVVEALAPQRSLSHSPLFQVMLAYDNTPRSAAIVPGLQWTLEAQDNGTAKFDLNVSLRDDGAEIRGSFDYATALFDASTIAGWAVHFREVLGALLASPQQRIATLPLLDAAQRQQVLRSFNDTACAYPRDLPIHCLFEQQVLRSPTACAVDYEGQTLSYAELEARANQLAWQLRALGAGPQQRVAICVERSLDLAVGVLGILKSGAAYVPIDPEYPGERIAHMLEDAAPPVIVTQAALQQRLPPSAAVKVLLDSHAEQIAQQPCSAIDPAAIGLHSEHLAYVIYTSGSTGRPKGVALPHRALVNLLCWHVRTLRPARRVLQFASLSFDASFHELFAAWLCGGAVAIPTQEVRRDARLLVDYLQRQAIDKAIFPVVLLQHLAEHYGDEPERFAALREVMATGEQLKITKAMRRWFAQLPECRFHNHYGPSETHVVTALSFGPEPEQWPTEPSIGTPIANTQIYILDRERQPVPVGVIGEVYIGGDGVAHGYLNRPELNAERFVADGYADKPGALMYKSGDLGRWRADGAIEYLGRNDHQVKIRGFRVEPGEVEATLLAHPQVHEAAVITRADARGEQRLVAYVTAHRGQPVPDAEILRTYLLAALPDYMVPAAYVGLAEFPQTPNGKLDRAALPAPTTESARLSTGGAAQTPTEQTLAALWAELLPRQSIGREDNFFALGGHSLLALQVLTRVQQAFAVELRLKDIFERQSLQALAAWIDHLAHALAIQAAADASDDREQFEL